MTFDRNGHQNQHFQADIMISGTGITDFGATLTTFVLIFRRGFGMLDRLAQLARFARFTLFAWLACRTYTALLLAETTSDLNSKDNLLGLLGPLELENLLF